MIFIYNDMITQFKIFENSQDINCYGRTFYFLLRDSNIIDICERIKTLNIIYHFYNNNNNSVTIYIYTDEKTMDKYFDMFYIQQYGDDYAKHHTQSDLDDFILELTVKNYNI